MTITSNFLTSNVPDGGISPMGTKISAEAEMTELLS